MARQLYEWLGLIILVRPMGNPSPSVRSYSKGGDMKELQFSDATSGKRCKGELIHQCKLIGCVLEFCV